MPRCQVKTVMRKVARSVDDAGVCAETEEGKRRIIDSLNRGVALVMKRIDTDGMIFQWHVPTCSGCFALPADCLQGRQYFVNGNSAISRDEYYLAKLSRGLNYGGVACSRAEIIDLGDFAIPVPVPKIRGVRVALVALDDGDAGAECTVEIVDEYGKRIREKVVLLANQAPAIMEAVCYDVTFFEKLRTKGPVSLQFHFDTGQREHVCQFDPRTTVGAWRRKRLPQMYRGCNVVTIRGKLRFEPVETEDDILPFDDLDALEYAMQADNAIAQKDFDARNKAVTFAINELAKELENADSPGNVSPMVIRSGFGGNMSQAGNRKCWA